MATIAALGSSNYALTITLSRSDPLADIAEVKETPDNEIVFQELRECRRLIEKKLLPRIKSWAFALERSETPFNTVAKNEKLDELLAILDRLSVAQEKMNELGVKYGMFKTRLVVDGLKVFLICISGV